MDNNENKIVFSFLRAPEKFAAPNLNFSKKRSSKALIFLIWTHKRLTNIQQITVTMTPIFDKKDLDRDLVRSNQTGSFRELCVGKSKKINN